MVFQSESCRCAGGIGEDDCEEADCESGDFVLCMTGILGCCGTNIAADIRMEGGVIGIADIDCLP